MDQVLGLLVDADQSAGQFSAAIVAVDPPEHMNGGTGSWRRPASGRGAGDLELSHSNQRGGGAPEVIELLDRLPDETGGQLDDWWTAQVYARDSAIAVEERRIRLTRTAPDVPELTLVAGVQLVPRSESSAVLLAPRAAVAATTPPAEDEVITAEDGGIARTVVPVDDSTDEVTVAVLGSWLRTPVGEKLYDLSTWPLLPYATGVVALALAVWLRTWILGQLVAMARRLRKSAASNGGDSEPVALHGGARRVPRPRPQHASVAGIRRSRDRLPTPREDGPPRRAKRR